MNNEFDKLDLIMERTKPKSKEQLVFLGTVPKQRSYLLTALLGSFCVFLVLFTVVNRENQKINHIVELSDVLMWDVTSDEAPEVFETTLAFLDD